MIFNNSFHYFVIGASNSQAPAEPEPASASAEWSIKPPDKNAKRRAKSEEQSESDEADGDEDDEVDSDDGDRRALGIGPHVTEEWRERIDFERFKDTDFTKDPEAKEECCRIIVHDMTKRFNLGVTIPQNARRNFKGKDIRLKIL